MTKQKKMNSLPAFVVVALVLFMANLVQSQINYCSTSGDSNNNVLGAMKKCNSRIKDCYEKHQNRPLKELYCRGMKFLLKCAWNEYNSFTETDHCNSDLLDRWLFVSYQYALIGQRLGVCQGAYSIPQAWLDTLKEKFDQLSVDTEVKQFKTKNIYYAAISGVQEKTCAKDIHGECAKKLVIPADDLCTNVHNFVGCYKNEIANVPASCNGQVPTISSTFNTVIQYFSNYIIDIYEGDDLKDMMCTVDPRVLQGSC